MNDVDNPELLKKELDKLDESERNTSSNNITIKEGTIDGGNVDYKYIRNLQEANKQ